MRKLLNECKRIVIKVGTSTLTYENANLNLALINQLAWVLTDLKNQGKDIILVSSGAIGVGSKKLGFKERPNKIEQKQAAAAIGQAELMHIYQNFFAQYSQNVAQILLTKEDFFTNERKKNTQNTINTLLDFGIIPIINANDTISTYEIEFSDNDSLSASVACMIDADLLIILSDIDAFYDKNPKTNKDAKKLSLVNTIDDEILAMGEGKGSEFSVGGMKTKLLAAKDCLSQNIKMAILNGERPQNINDLMNGDDIGTLFARSKDD